MDDLNIQAGVTVNAEQAERAFDNLGNKAQKMANEVTKAADKAGKATDGMGDGAENGAEKFTRAESRMRAAIQKSTRELEMLGKTASQKFEAQLEFKGLDKAKFQPFLAELRKTEEAAAKAQAGISGIGDAAKVAGSMMAAAFSGAALLGVVGKVVSVQREFDVLNSSLKTVTGSSEAAERELSWLKTFAKETPFGLAQATQGFVKMKALGLDPTRAALTSFGNTASAMGKDLNQMIEAVADASTGEFERLKEFGIKAKKEGDNVSLTFQGVTTTIKNSAAEITAYLEKIGNNQFGGAMEERAKTLDGTIAALGDTWDELFRTVSTNNVGGLIFDSVTLANWALEDATTILKAMGGAAQDAGRDTGALGTIQNGIATVFETVSVLGANLKFVLVGIGNEIGGLAAQVAQAAQFNFAGVRAIREQMVADAEAARREVDATTARILNARRAQEEYARWATRNASAATDPRRIDLGGNKPSAGAGSAGKAVKETLSEYDKLIKKLSEELPKAAAEAEAAQMGYNKAQAEFIALAGSEAWAKFSNTQRATVAALYESKIASEQAGDAAKTLAKAEADAVQTREKYLASLATGIDKIKADIAAQEDATARMGLTKEAVAELDAAKLEMLATDAELQAIKALDRNLDQQTYDALKEQAKLYRDLAAAKKIGAAKETALDLEKANAEAAKKAAEDWQRASDDINRSLTDALLRGFESGKDFAKNLRDTIKNMFSTLVLRPIISAVVNPVAGAITGALGLSGTASAATGGAAAVGGAGNLLTAASLAGNSSFMMGLSGAWGAGGGLVSTLNAGASLLQTGTLSSITSGLGTIAGALAPIALGFVALSSLIKKSTPHTGGIGAYSADSGATTGAAVGLAFGIDQKHYTQAGEELSTSVAKGIVQILDSTATTFGKQAGYYAATAFADDSSKDGAWGALRIKFGEKVLLDWADTAVRDANVPREFADGEAGQKQYLAAVASEVRVALDSIGMPAWATGMLDKLGQGASIEQLAGAVDQINAAKAAFAGFAQYMPTFAGLADTAISKLVDASGGAQALAGNMATFVDQFYTDAEKLAVNTENVRVAMDKLGFQMPTTRDEFAALVKANIALGDAGADTVAKLLQVAGAFASVTAASDAASVAATKALAEEKAIASDRRAFVQARREAQDAQQRAELDAIEASKTAAADLFKSIQDHIKGIDDWLKGTLLDTNSLLSPEAKVQEAQAQFDALYAQAARGDATAMGQLTSAASALRDMARDAYASSGAYGSIETDLRARLAALDAGAFDPNRPAVQATEWSAGSGNGNGGPTVAEVMAATGLSFQAAAGLTSYRNASGQYAAGTADLSGGITVDALRDAARSLALGDGGAASWSTWAGGDGIERLRLALADGTYAQTDAGNASGVYDMAFRLGLTDAEARAGLALTGDGQKAGGQWWVNNWNEQAAAIGNWVKTSGQGQDTMTHLYQIRADASRASQEQVEAVRASGSANAQGLVEQTQVLQSIDRRLANMESSNRMGAIA